jgi:hypothetical protein
MFYVFHAQRNLAFSLATLVLYISMINPTTFTYVGSSGTSSYVKGTSMVTCLQGALWAIGPMIKVLWPGQRTMVGRRRMAHNISATGCTYFSLILYVLSYCISCCQYIAHSFLQYKSQGLEMNIVCIFVWL